LELLLCDLQTPDFCHDLLLYLLQVILHRA
jgi:hypothetical protein